MDTTCIHRYISVCVCAVCIYLVFSEPFENKFGQEAMENSWEAIASHLKEG